MSKKNKKRSLPSPAPASHSAGNAGSRKDVSPAEDLEPVAEHRPVPIFLIILLVLLIYGGDMYVMDHGADVLGKTGPFPKLVFDPYRYYDELDKANPVSPAEEARRKGRAVFMMTCMACHQASGQGLPGQFPPLAGSDWVNAEGANRIIRIVLNGASGSFTVLGQQFNNTMPPWKETLTDEQIANVLTYVRSEWGNKAAPVTVEQVKKVRDQVKDRSEPSAESELKNLSDKVD